jgi:hypothetical protein
MLKVTQRTEERNRICQAVLLTGVDQSWVTEYASTQDISARGARVTTERVWKPGSLVLLKSVRSDFQARARVVYWRSFSSSRFAIGLEFLTRVGDWPANTEEGRRWEA